METGRRSEPIALPSLLTWSAITFSCLVLEIHVIYNIRLPNIAYRKCHVLHDRIVSTLWNVMHCMTWDRKRLFLHSLTWMVGHRECHLVHKNPASAADTLMNTETEPFAVQWRQFSTTASWWQKWSRVRLLSYEAATNIALYSEAVAVLLPWCVTS